MANSAPPTPLSEADIPGSSLNGRNPNSLKAEELRFWLKCRGDTLKGLKTKSQLVKRTEEYINSGRAGNIVDPDADKIYTKRKRLKDAQRQKTADKPAASVQSATFSRDFSYPEDGWTSDLKRMPFFTRAEMNAHISRSGKNIDPKTSTHTVPTCIKKATTFLNDEYLKEILACSDEKHFYFKARCHHSFRKNDPPHTLKLKLCLITGEVIHANCTCVAGKVGFCNHVLALMLKVCKYSLYECKNVHDLDTEDDMNPNQTCTDRLQRWHNRGRQESITPSAVMDVTVYKTNLQANSKSSKEPGVKCLLYEARNNPKTSKAAELKLKENLKTINSNMALAQMLTPSSPSKTRYIETKFGKSPQGSFASYQLSFTEDNFKVYLDIDSVQRGNSAGVPLFSFPDFPLNSPPVLGLQPAMPLGSNPQELQFLNSLSVDKLKINEIERKTVTQKDCDDWRKERQFRFTASNFGLISCRKRNHETLVDNLLHPKPFYSRYTAHGNKYESVALREYQKYMHTIKKPVIVFKSGFVVSLEDPYLGASPDAKVIDPTCMQPFGLVEIKCPQTKFMVTPLDACSDDNFYLDEINGKPKLKQSHMYYKQIQGQLGITGAKWCDFVVYTGKGMSIERVPFNNQFWTNLNTTLKSYYFKHFLPEAAKEYQSSQQNS